jgi:hypothetical protein
MIGLLVPAASTIAETATPEGEVVVRKDHRKSAQRQAAKCSDPMTQERHQKSSCPWVTG